MSNPNHTSYADYCTEQAMTHDRERLLVAMLAPLKARRALVALLAWNLEIARIGEIASDEMLGLIRFQWWREALDEIYQGNPPRQHAVVLELAEAIRAHGLPQEVFTDILDAREADLDRAPFATQEELESYARRTGGAFLALWMRVLGVDEPDAFLAASHVGTAWALLGNLRALHHVAHQGKLRLPTESLDADAVLQQGFPPETAEVVKRIALLAERHLAQARALRGHLPKAALPPLYLAVLAEDFLARLKAGGYDPASPKAGQGRVMRALRLWWASLRRCY